MRSTVAPLNVEKESIRTQSNYHSAGTTHFTSSLSTQQKNPDPSTQTLGKQN